MWELKHENFLAIILLNCYTEFWIFKKQFYAEYSHQVFGVQLFILLVTCTEAFLDRHATSCSRKLSVVWFSPILNYFIFCINRRFSVLVGRPVRWDLRCYRASSGTNHHSFVSPSTHWEYFSWNRVWHRAHTGVRIVAQKLLPTIFAFAYHMILLITLINLGQEARGRLWTQCCRDYVSLIVRYTGHA